MLGGQIHLIAAALWLVASYAEQSDTWHALIAEEWVRYPIDTCSGLTCFEDQIEEDLRRFKERGSNFNSSQFKHLLRHGLGEHYQVVNHRLYRQKQCTFSSRCSGNEHFLLRIVADLPDMEMVINTFDYPKSHKHNGSPPVFSFSKPAHYNDVMYPAWTFWEGGPVIMPFYPRGMERWDLHRNTMVESAKKWPWSKKSGKAFFRGSRTSEVRDPLILMSRKEPDLFDCRFTKNQAWKSKDDTLGEDPAPEMTMEEHCQYKYLFNFRGIAASFRFKYLFLCRSLVFHVGNEWQEFFYPSLKPWVHYIPVSESLAEARDLVQFFQDNQQLAEKIANRGHEFILNNLDNQVVEAYWRKLLLGYSKVARWKVQLDPALVPIGLRKDEF